MKVLIGTKNPAKIEGAKRAFEHFFSEFEIEGFPVNSDVPDEPVNNQICLGAKNRATNVRKYAKENGIEADYYIGIESGITNLLGEWLIVNMAAIEDNNGNVSVGSSSGFPVPDKYVDEIINTDLGKVMDRIFNDTNLNRKQGGVSLLTNGVVSRSNLTETAFVMALTKFVNGQLWR